MTKDQSFIPPEPGELATDHVRVRILDRQDSDQVAKIDALHSGRSRRDFFRRKIDTALRDPGVSLSLTAEIDQQLVGFLIGSVDHGEFGVMEPVAVLDAIGVHPDYRGQSVGRALLRQLALNLGALDIERLATQVDWRQHDLLHFLERSGFAPVPRLCLEVRVEDIPVG